jgi:hypothetical protein
MLSINPIIEKKPLKLMFGIIFVTLIACSKKTSTQPPPSSTGKYFLTVKTIIHNNCLSCHSSSGTWSGNPIAFDSDSAIALQHTSIKASVADSVTFFNLRMPKGGALSQNDITHITKRLTNNKSLCLFVFIGGN